LSYIRFKFADIYEENDYRLKGKMPVTITVFIKVRFDSDNSHKLPNGKMKWTKDDEDKYSNLTIVKINVYGNE
jgi:hypothetical protein